MRLRDLMARLEQLRGLVDDPDVVDVRVLDGGGEYTFAVRLVRDDDDGRHHIMLDTTAVTAE